MYEQQQPPGPSSFSFPYVFFNSESSRPCSKIVAMEDAEFTPDRCRQHAEACREMARRETHAASAKSFEELAATWEQLALSLLGVGQTSH
jgi:hypothetical protein